MLIARTLLFVPANRERMVAHALTAPADVITLDLEDSVPSNAKDAARATVRASIEQLKAAGKRVHVRVNHLDTGLTRDDLAAAVGEGLDGILFPKAESAAQIRELDVLIRQMEMRSGVRPGTAVLIPSIETAMGVLRCEEIATASTRIAGLALGGEDYVRDLGIGRTRDGRELDYIRSVLAHVALAHKLTPLDGVFPDIRDGLGLVADAERAQSLGMKGKYVIHPDQIGPVNRAFTPTDDEIQTARLRLAAYEEAVARGEGSVEVDGRMVDEPVARRAQDLLAYAEAVGALRPD
jgi:citrate lyase subunit beta/citryl-CoA lyase